MALDYTYLKYKDVHTLRNNGVFNLSYTVNTVTCETVVQSKSGTILPQQTITLDFTVDGTYSVRVFTSTENARPFTVKFYNNLLKSFISMADQILCNCGKCQDCEECNDCQDYLSTYTKAQAYTAINSPVYEDYISQVTQDSICLYTEETLCTLLKEKVYGTAETKKMLFQLISFHYLGFYYQDLTYAIDTAEVDYINTKYKFDRIGSCMKSIGIFPRNPIDIPPPPDPIEFPVAPVGNANGPYCLGGTATQLSAVPASGNTLRWYTVPTAGTFTTNAPTPSTSAVGSTTYYVSQVNNLLYESNRTPITVVVNPVLTAYAIVTSTSVSACNSASITFTAIPVNGGNAPTYQWWLNGAAVVGQIASTYTLASPESGDEVYVVMTSNATPCLVGSPTISNKITLIGSTVTPTVVITSSVSGTVCPGVPIAFSVASSSNMGTTPTYQWKKDGVVISGATGATYTSSSLTNGASITLVMTSSLDAGCLTASAITSNAKVVSISTPAVITSQPTNLNLCPNTTATFSVTATGTGLTYQWKKNGTIIPGATSATYAINNIAAGNTGAYSVVVSNTCGSVSSLNANLTLKTATSITTPPTNINQLAGSTVTFSVTAAGQGTLTYQWKKGTVDISGATNSTLVLTNIQSADAGNYSVVVTGECGTATASASLTIGTPPSSRRVIIVRSCPDENGNEPDYTINWYASNPTYPVGNYYKIAPYQATYTRCARVISNNTFSTDISDAGFFNSIEMNNCSNPSCIEETGYIPGID